MEDRKQCVRFCAISASDLTTTGVTELKSPHLVCDVQKMSDLTFHVDSSQMVVGGAVQTQNRSNQQL